MSTVQVGFQPVQIVYAADPQGVVFNRSITTPVFWGPTEATANRADASILDPNATLAVDENAEVWMSTGQLGVSVTVDYHPNSVAFFRGITSGLGSLVIPSIHSPNFVHNASGWTINSDGSAEFNNLLLRGTFTSTTVRISTNGIFLYVNPPGPQAGNIPIAGLATGTTDDFGNVFISGDMVGGGSVFFRNAAGAFSQLALFNSQPGLVAGTGDASEKFPLFANAIVIGSGATRQEVGIIQGPTYDPSGVLNTLMNLISASQDGTSIAPEWKLVVGGGTMIDVIGPLAAAGGKITFGGVPNQQMIWDDTAFQLNFNLAGSGPFIKGEGFHNITLATGWAGQLRVKLLPWNMVHLNCQLNATSATSGGVSITFGSLPSLSYYPLFSSHFPVALTGASFAATGSFLGSPRWNFPNSGVGGAVHLEIPTLSASVTPTIGCDIVYPTN